EDHAREAESLFQTHGASINRSDEDRVFEQSWAEMLVAAALQRLADEYKREEKEKVFEQLRIFLTGGEPLPNYAELAARMAVPVVTVRSHVSRLRGRYREALRAEVRRTVDTDAEVDDELRELLRVLTQ